MKWKRALQHQNFDFLFFPPSPSSPLFSLFLLLLIISLMDPEPPKSTQIPESPLTIDATSTTDTTDTTIIQHTEHGRPTNEVNGKCYDAPVWNFVNSGDRCIFREGGFGMVQHGNLCVFEGDFAGVISGNHNVFMGAVHDTRVEGAHNHFYGPVDNVTFTCRNNFLVPGPLATPVESSQTNELGDYIDIELNVPLTYGPHHRHENSNNSHGGGGGGGSHLSDVTRQQLATISSLISSPSVVTHLTQFADSGFKSYRRYPGDDTTTTTSSSSSSSPTITTDRGLMICDNDSEETCQNEHHNHPSSTSTPTPNSPSSSSQFPSKRSRLQFMEANEDHDHDRDDHNDNDDNFNSRFVKGDFKTDEEIDAILQRLAKETSEAALNPELAKELELGVVSSTLREPAIPTPPQISPSPSTKGSLTTDSECSICMETPPPGFNLFVIRCVRNSGQILRHDARFCDNCMVRFDECPYCKSTRFTFEVSPPPSSTSTPTPLLLSTFRQALLLLPSSSPTPQEQNE